MGLDPSKWRDASAYDFADDLPVDALAWEFLRRNPAYQKHYREIGESGADPEAVDAAIRLHWGLRFRG
jgi:hypothetical protein